MFDYSRKFSQTNYSFCDECERTGEIFMYNKITGVRYVFRCNCIFGKNIGNKNYPIFDNDIRSRYYSIAEWLDVFEKNNKK
jgi:hypothetical protein